MRKAESGKQKVEIGLVLGLLMLVGVQTFGQPVPSTTPYSRYLLLSTNQADAQIKLGVNSGTSLGTNLNGNGHVISNAHFVGDFVGNGSGLSNTPIGITNLMTTNSSAGVVTVIRSNSVIDMNTQTGLSGGAAAAAATPSLNSQFGFSHFGAPASSWYAYTSTGTGAGQWSPNISFDFALPCNFGTSAGYSPGGPQWKFYVNTDPGNYTNLDLLNDADGVILTWNANVHKYTQIGMFGSQTNGLGIPSIDFGNWIAIGVGNQDARGSGGKDEGLAGVGFVVMADHSHEFAICSTGTSDASTALGAYQQVAFDFDGRKTHFLEQVLNVESYTNAASRDVLLINGKTGTINVLSNSFARQGQATNFWVVGVVPAGTLGPPYATGVESSTNIGSFTFTNSVFDNTAQTAAGAAGTLAFDGGNAGKYRFGLYQRFGQYPSIVHASGAPLQFGRLDVDDVNRRNGNVTAELTIDSSGSAVFTGSVAIGSGTPILKVLSATAALDFASTSAQNSRDLTITVTGAALADVVSLGVPNAAVNANACYTAFVSAADTVTVRFNNYSAGAVDPASATFRATVIKH